MYYAVVITILLNSKIYLTKNYIRKRYSRNLCKNLDLFFATIELTG